MKIVVMKFGGTSVANIEKIKNVAQKVSDSSKNAKIVVVLSAMSGVTNQLQSYIDGDGNTVQGGCFYYETFNYLDNYPNLILFTDTISK